MSTTTQHEQERSRHQAVHERVSQRLLQYQPAADYLGCSIVQLYRFVRSGAISPVRMGRSVRFDIRELDRFIDELATEQAAAR